MLEGKETRRASRVSRRVAHMQLAWLDRLSPRGQTPPVLFPQLIAGPERRWRLLLPSEEAQLPLLLLLQAQVRRFHGGHGRGYCRSLLKANVGVEYVQN